MTHAHTKPFNLEHAQAGAPVGARGGYSTPEILKYGADRIFGTLTMDKEESACWGLDGRYGILGEETVLDLVMLPLGYCEDKPVFVGDVLLDPRMDGDEEFTICAGENYDGLHNCTWPKPKSKYPETRMSQYDMCLSVGMNHHNMTLTEKHLLDMSNAAIANAIQDGDVFTRPQVGAVIKSIIDICTRNTNNNNIIHAIHGSDWDAVMKAVLK